MLSADQLLAGAAVTYEVELPAAVTLPGGQRKNGKPGREADREPLSRVRLRPLTVHDLQVISRAAKESDALTATLMVQRALVEPEVTMAQVGSMHVGLLHFLLERVNEISGIRASEDEVRDAGRAPIARAAHILAQEFGWTPREVNDLTLGQVLLHLEMIAEGARG